MAEFIDKKTALSFPFANGQYDHQNANAHFIYGCETYKEWLETLPAADVVEVVRCKDCALCTYSRLAGQHLYHCVDGKRVKPNFYCADGKRGDNNGKV